MSFPTERRFTASLKSRRSDLEHSGEQLRLARELEGLLEDGAAAAYAGLAAPSSRDWQRSGREDALPPLEDQVVTRQGDLWLLGSHRLVRSEASDPAA